MKDKRLDAGSYVVILLTLALFAVSLWTKGLSHDLLLEAGVFVVSVKLIIMAYKNSAANRELLHRMEELRTEIQNGQSNHSRGEE